MRKLAFLALLLCGCASTTIHDPRTGHVVFRTQADAENITYTGPGYSFTARRLIHSVPTSEGGRAAAKIIQSSGVAAGEIGMAIAAPVSMR